MREAVIVSAVRTAVGKAPKGTLRATRPDDLARRRHPGRAGARAQPRQQGSGGRDHRLRHAGRRAGHERGAHRLPARRPAHRILRHDHQPLSAPPGCSPSRWRRSASAAAAPTSSWPAAPNPCPSCPWAATRFPSIPGSSEHYPDSYLSMGLTAERVAQHYGITREAGRRVRPGQPPEGAGRAGRRQVRSRRSCRCRSPSPRRMRSPRSAKTEVDLPGGRRPARRHFARSAGASSKPAFHAKGTVTAGNSSQTSDGAAAAVVMSGGTRRARWASSRWRASWPSPMPAACPKRWASARSTPSPRR